MVFKPFTHLARRSTKAFAHGYAQSLAAASQSSYASSTTPLGQFNHHRFGRSGSAQHREAFHTAAHSQNSAAKPSLGSPLADPHHDGTLDAYFAAWQKHQPGEEWQQFQFTKRIGWKSSQPSQSRLIEKDGSLVRQESSIRSGISLDRAYSANAVEDIKKPQGDTAEAAALLGVDKAISKEITDIENESSKSNDAAHTHEQSSVNAEVRPPGQLRPATPLTSRSLTPETSKASEITSDSNFEGVSTNAHVEHIVELELSQNYDQIPAVFESMLRSGVVPPSKAYNSLMVAAVHLSDSIAKVIPKALDAYADMLRRKVFPDTKTYTILLELLSLRALEVARTKPALELAGLRFGGAENGGHSLLRSQETELEILGEDDSLAVAIRLFDSSMVGSKDRTFSTGTYRALISACAVHGDVEQMIRFYSHMESRGVTPSASIYPLMIRAFATSGDLRSAVECYNEYKKLAVADDNGTLSLINRADNEVYAAVIRSYLSCGKSSGAERFFEKIAESYERSVHDPTASRELIVLQSFFQHALDSGKYQAALELLDAQSLSPAARENALELITEAAADQGAVDVAAQSYAMMSSLTNTILPSIAMLAMHLRRGDISTARHFWSKLSIISNPDRLLIEPTAMFAVALIRNGFVDEALEQARQSFGRVRASARDKTTSREITESIDESIELISLSLVEKGVVPSAEARMGFMWAMVENGGLIAPVAERLLAGLRSEDIAKLTWQDLKLALQVEAGIICSGRTNFDIAHSARFVHLLETALSHRIPFDRRTIELVESSLNNIGPGYADLAYRFQANKGLASNDVILKNNAIQRLHHPQVPSPAYNDNFDPYANGLDQRGSSMIVEELEKQGIPSSQGLNEALAKFRNIRRAGKHPRYIAYAKLIGAAAKEGRVSLFNDLFAMAEQDMPSMPQYPVVRHGWITIYDAMVGAHLTTGNRRIAADYHQKLLDMGAAPSANTYGLYITTLKESTRTFDEATEAVNIFHRALSEGVEPSSFLYNALIGKLGKARRIDDCLYHFAEMRSRGIRPTSVTYGTIVNALCRVSDERFAQDLFDEMESMPNYKPRPAPYNSMMQFFLTTKRDSSKVLEYYQRMQSRNIKPTMHTYKLLIDTYATLEPINLTAASAVLDTIRSTGQSPEAVHYASLIHAKGCVLHDMAGATAIFQSVAKDPNVRPQASLYQAYFESMVANHCVRDTAAILQQMTGDGVVMTAYIANTLIHGWALERNLSEAKAVYEKLGKEKREPSTYEAMTRAFLAAEDRQGASDVANEMLSRGYPSAVSSKILELLGNGSRAASAAPKTSQPAAAPST